jgi:hypothetical protein
VLVCSYLSVVITACELEAITAAAAAAAAAAAGFVGNPPWQVSTELYQELLRPAGEAV